MHAELPCGPEDRPEGSAADPPERPGRRPGEAPRPLAPGQPISLLIVETDRALAERLAEAARGRGCVPRIACGREEVREAVAEVTPHVVLVGLGPYPGDGCALAREVKRPGGGKAPVLIGLGRTGTQPDQGRLAEAGFDLYVARLGRAEELIRHLSLARGTDCGGSDAGE